jgi:phosphoenolpyruvate---glycerone phosphotransferase subunit DhaL
MKDTIRIAEMKRMFAAAADQIRQEHENLSRLDSIGGDGDHGTAMLRGFETLDAAMEADGANSMNGWLKNAGWSMLGVDGGASTAILGTFIAGMGDAETGQECDCEQLAASFAAGLRALAKQTRARPGDKTMMDALFPAVEAFQAAASAGKTVAAAMEDAAEAARLGAETTSQMVARYGRAKFLGEKTRGSPDAGATSIALMFRGFSTGLNHAKEA